MEPDATVRHRDPAGQSGRGASGGAPHPSDHDGDDHSGKPFDEPRPPPESPPGGGPPGGDPPPGGGPPGDDDDDGWDGFSLGRALVELRSVRPGVVRRALRRLHLRWYHAGAATMKRLLSLAGVPAAVTNQVSSVVDTCKICRSWSRPAPKSVATSRISETLQADLLVYKRRVILHVVDEATRYSMACVIPNRSEEAIKQAFSTGWLPPGKIIADGEGGIMSLDSWFQSKKIRPPSQGSGTACATDRMTS